MKAFLGAGIRLEGKTVGTIYTGRRPGARPFSKEDENVLRVVVAAAAVAIDRARQFIQLRELADQLEQRVKERTKELVRKNEMLRRREMELEAVNQELEEAMRMKDEFIPTASHELRTPLNAVVGFAELLGHPRYGELSPKQKEFLDRIVTSARRLVSIINDMLDISRIESGRMTVHESAFELSKFAFELEGELASLAAEKNIHYRVQSLSSDVVADEAKIHQILVNLLGNALKFTPEGGKVEGVLRLEGEDLVAEVKDTGIGIPEKDLERIFRPFEQVETGATRQYKGTGLGLALSRKMAEFLGGTLTARSKVGKGSVFTLRVPVKVEKKKRDEKLHAHGAPLQPAAVGGTDKATASAVLIIDDDAARASTVQRLLEKEGYYVERSDLKEAIKRAHSLYPFVILLGDTRNPKRLAQNISILKRDEAVAEIPLVLVSGDANRPRFVPGAIEFTGERIDAQRLLDRISCYGRLLAPVRQQPTVLLVDDDESIREMLQEALTSTGWRVVAAGSSGEAERLAEEVEPNVIVLDLMLPDGSGFELLEKLTLNPTTSDIPVVIHTERSLGAGDLARLGAAAEHVVVKGAGGGLDLINHLRKMELAYPVRARLVDPVLDVRNHRYFRLRLEQECRLTRRHNYPLALVGWEVNEVDAYRKAHGHRWTTVMLREMCDLVRGRLRASDEIARIGFARFVAILLMWIKQAQPWLPKSSGCGSCMGAGAFLMALLVNAQRVSPPWCFLDGGLPRRQNNGCLQLWTKRRRRLIACWSGAREALLTRREGEMKVLIVDDEPFNLELLVEVLTIEGFDVVTATDGVEAVEAFQREHPDAVLMDIRMPRMNGLDAMKRIRELPGGKDRPILYLTASGFGKDRDRFLAEGFDGYIQKPIDPWDVTQQLHSICSRS